MELLKVQVFENNTIRTTRAWDESTKSYSVTKRYIPCVLIVPDDGKRVTNVIWEDRQPTIFDEIMNEIYNKRFVHVPDSEKIELTDYGILGEMIGIN